MSAQSPSPPGSAGADFAFDQGENLDCLGGPKQRFLYNLAAIELLKRLEAEGRRPTNPPRWFTTWLRKTWMFVPCHVAWLPLTSGTRSERRAQAFRPPLLCGPGMPFFLSMGCRNQILKLNAAR